MLQTSDSSGAVLYEMETGPASFFRHHIRGDLPRHSCPASKSPITLNSELPTE